MTRRPAPGPVRSQAGVTMVLAALMVTALCGAAALAVDVGVMFGAEGAAQNAADAAALAGAYTFLDPAATQPTAAENAAIEVGDSNQVLGKGVSLTAGNVSVDQTNAAVTVTVAATAPSFFSTVLGDVGFNLSATATAQAAPSIAGNLKPFLVPLSLVDSATPGEQVVLRPTQLGNAAAPGQYYSLDFGSGASTYRCALGNPLADCGVAPMVAACGLTYTTENGAMIGPTDQGIETLLTSTPDTWLGVGRYQEYDGQINNTSPQLIVAPVWDDITDPLQPGKQTVSIVGFSTWFVTGLGNQGVNANFVGTGSCTEGGTINTNAPGLNMPIRLVTPN